jgi:hypothetical protein
VLLGLVIIVLLIAAPAAYLVWRFKHGGEELVPGGSHGSQMFGAKKDDWEPK